MINILLTIFAIMCLVGQYFVQKRNYIGLIMWIVADIGWVVYNLFIGEIIQASLWIAYLGLSIYGLLDWKFPFWRNK